MSYGWGKRLGWPSPLRGQEVPTCFTFSSLVLSPHTQRMLRRAPRSLCHSCLKLFGPHPCPPMRPRWSASVTCDQCHSILSTLRPVSLFSMPQLPHFTPGEGGSPLRCTWGEKCTQVPFTKPRHFSIPSAVCCGLIGLSPMMKDCPHFQSGRPTLGRFEVPLAC